MPREAWPLRHGRPCVQISLALTQGGLSLPRALLADSGAGSLLSGFELILDEDDCLFCGGNPLGTISLGGAYSGLFPVYLLPVNLLTLAFAKYLRVVGVPSVPAGFDGIACFSFLNRFHYGNFGDPALFGLES